MSVVLYHTSSGSVSISDPYTLRLFAFKNSYFLRVFLGEKNKEKLATCGTTLDHRINSNHWNTFTMKGS